MLSRLSIRDIVLIDRLDIDFAAGLAVLTGETGGKIDVEPVDQNDVADRKSGEHELSKSSNTWSCPDSFRLPTPCRFAIIKDAEGRHKAGHETVDVRKRLVSVIPGRAEGADPESRCNLRILVLIPGSLAARAPRNDRLGQPSPTFLNALLIQEPWFSFGTAPPDVTS